MEGSTATITHAAAISSTGDVELDALLPLDERYCIQTATAVAVCRARVRGGRVVAIGSSVVGADDAAPADGSVRRGTRLTTQRIGRVAACAWWTRCFPELRNRNQSLRIVA